jgi:hypothetical protein
MATVKAILDPSRGRKAITAADVRLSQYAEIQQPKDKIRFDMTRTRRRIPEIFA